MNIVLRDRQAGGYDFCKPAGVISSQGAKPRGMKLLPRVSKNHMPPSLAITQQYCYIRLLNKKPQQNQRKFLCIPGIFRQFDEFFAFK